MKFTVAHSLIGDTMNKIGKLLNAKHSIPVLSHVLVEAKEDCLIFTASDSHESMIHRVLKGDVDQLEVETPGKYVFPREALDIVKKLKGSVTFDVTDTTVQLTQDKTALSFSVIQADEYPNITFEPKDEKVIFSGKDFSQFISKTAFAASESETRPVLQGVNMKFTKEGATFSCTDSHRLSQVTHQVDSMEANLVVPAKTLQHTLKSFDFSKDVIVIPTETQIALINGNTIYYSRLLEGNYPEVNRLIPTSAQSELICNREELLNCLDLLSDISTNRVATLTISALFMEIKASGDNAKAKKEIAFESYDGEADFQIAFSTFYLRDALKALDSKSVKLQFSGAMRPFLITSTEENQNVLQLVTPVRMA